jgi:hypothetical protein
MTLKLERCRREQLSTLRLIGNARADDLAEIADELAMCGPEAALDLEEVTVVSVEVIRFLGQCEKRGNALLSCPAYVREWIVREREQED